MAGLLMGTLGWPGSASADSPERRANALYNEAKDLIAEGKLDAAVQKLSEAWDTFQHPLIVKKRAEVQEKRLEFEAAIADYRVFLTRLSSRKKAERRLVLERIAALEAVLQRPVKVTIVTSGARVPVSVDGGEAARAPVDVSLVPGEHVATVMDSAFQATSQRFTVRPARPRVVTIEPVPRRGQVVIETDRESFADTELTIDRTAVDLTAAEVAARETTPRSYGIGTHSLACKQTEIPVYYTEFEIQEGNTTRVVCQFELVDPSVIDDPWGWVTAGAGIAALGAGIGLMVSYASDVQLAEERNQDLITDKHIYGGVLLGVGVGLGVASYFVFTRDRGEPEAAFQILPTEGGVLLGGAGRF